MTLKNILLYQAHGHTDFIHEAIYSILSLYQVEKNAGMLFQIVIYTDNAPYFQSFLPQEVRYQTLAPETVQEWKSNPPFVHRVKIKMIEDCMLHFEGNILYMDTDTVFRESPLPLFEKIADGKYIMHEKEGKLSNKSNPLFSKLARFFRKTPHFLNNSVTITPDFEMFNAGVLGFSSKELQKDISRILALSDTLYAQYPKHVMEQIAFTHYFSLQSLPETAQKEIYHYWFYKEFRKVLNGFFQKNKQKTQAELLAKLPEINPEKNYTPTKKPSFWNTIFGKRK